MPVCARDTGAYLGFLAVLGVFLLGKRYERKMAPDRLIMAFAALGVGLYLFDASSSYLGFRTTTNELRLLCGLAFGSGIALMILSALSITLFKGSKDRRVFSYPDLAVFIPLLALAAFPFLVDLGIIAYYIVATIAMAGYLVLTLFIITLLLSVLRSWNLADHGIKVRLLGASLALELLFVVALWTIKYFIWPSIELPG